MALRPKILIVDDEPRMCDSVKILLGHLDYEIHTADSGDAAMALFKGNSYDLVLLDLILPKMDGYQIMGEMHRQDPGVLIVILTGHASIKSAVEALKRGAYDYLRKPFEHEDLIKTIQNALHHKKTETALRESEVRFREMADLLPTIICEADTNMRVTYINNAGLRIFDTTREDIERGVSLTDLIHPADIEKALQPQSSTAQGARRQGTEIRMTDRNGSELTLLMNATRIKEDDTVSGIRISMTDFTEQRMLQTRLQQARKMEAIASLSGGIAHEFNNSLMGIVGNVELLEMSLPEDKETHAQIEKILASTDRMAELTNQLLAYGRGGKYWPEKRTLKDIVQSTLASISRTHASTIRIETDLAAGDTVVEVDLVQMQMVISAVVANSVEAMDESGKIRISAENDLFDEKSARLFPGHKPGEYVCLSVEDNGRGMDKETKSKVFEPFFTTKFQGRGLTMAAVYGIVKNHHGWIGVESEPGQGTCVSIHLPVVKESVKPAETEKARLVSGSGTVLNIDDDETILAAVRPVLKKLGYRVLEARTGEEAVSIVQSDIDIDVALLNISLPDIRGDQLYPMLIKSRPGLKVILSSGYGMDTPVKEVLAAGAQDFIHKPYKLAALSVKIRKALEKRE